MTWFNRVVVRLTRRAPVLSTTLTGSIREVSRESRFRFPLVRELRSHPQLNRAQDFSAHRTTDLRHVLTTIGFKCDDGIIGTRWLSS